MNERSTTSHPRTDAGHRNRTFAAVAVAILAGLVVGGGFLVVRGGSSSAAPETTPVARGEAPASSSPRPSMAPRIREATARVTSRDPFAPIVSPSPTAASPTARATRSPEPPASASATPADGGTIALLSISPTGTSVTLKLDGRKYTVDEGETFAKSYRVYDIFNSNCAGFLYGDQSAVVCTGDSVVVG